MLKGDCGGFCVTHHTHRTDTTQALCRNESPSASCDKTKEASRSWLADELLNMGFVRSLSHERGLKTTTC